MLPTLQKPKVLILTGSLGDGHKQAAQALLEASGHYDSEAEVEVVDFMEWTHPRIHQLGKYCYLQWIKHFPSLYGYLFRLTRTDNTYSQLFKRIRLFQLGRMLELLLTVRPSVVVSTFPSAAAAMSVLKTHGLTTVPTVTVITDHTDHSYWVHPGTDRYAVGSQQVRDLLVRQGVQPSDVSVTGIPIRPQFAVRQDGAALRDKYGLDRKAKVVLVMGGGLGMFGRGLDDMLAADYGGRLVQFVIVCGRNDKLKRQLEARAGQCRHKLVVTGYVEEIHELMATADVMITKPGGLSTAEATAMKLPMLLVKPLPGQEQDNAAYLNRAGLAVQAAPGEAPSALLGRLLAHPEELEAMRARASMLRTRNAAFKTLRAVLQASADSGQSPIVRMPAKALRKTRAAFAAR
ncbi:glycosyltransferase [Paenibacillus sp. J31TS4]|uniref:MGDG synthase family glycosyltransferase n=1 Tax=Paenibacillus sp. J31TS4 TaxID=2807195 RepID=UPI0020BE6F01|nr:glycosyltransferase [Paenibacillus sp. J31TS4]